METEFRGCIWHISVNDFKLFEKALHTVLDYMWFTMACDTVRIEQLHFVHEDTEKGKKGEPEAEALLKPILAMNRRGFKWKSLGNDNGRRYQIMQMARPKDKVAANK